MNQVANGSRDLARRNEHEFAIVVIGPQGKIFVEHGLVFGLARIAVTKAHLVSAVIARLVAEHVEEQAIHVVLIECFGEDFYRLCAIVTTVDTG